MNYRTCGIVHRGLPPEPFRALPRGWPWPHRANYPNIPFGQFVCFSPLTCQVSRTIVDTAVRIGPDLEAGASPLPQKNRKRSISPAGNRVGCANARILGDKV